MIGYSMSKYAVRAFGEGLRREMKHLNVYVSVIEPVFYKCVIAKALSKQQVTIVYFLFLPADTGQRSVTRQPP